jgi:hypothetical protein
MRARPNASGRCSKLPDEALQGWQPWVLKRGTTRAGRSCPQYFLSDHRTLTSKRCSLVYSEIPEIRGTPDYIVYWLKYDGLTCVTHTHTHASTHTQTHTHTHTHTVTHARTHARTHTHTVTHARTYTHTNTHTRTHAARAHTHHQLPQVTDP